MKPPVFREGNVVYNAATCSALANAVHRGDVNAVLLAKVAWLGAWVRIL